MASKRQIAISLLILIAIVNLFSDFEFLSTSPSSKTTPVDSDREQRSSTLPRPESNKNQEEETGEPFKTTQFRSSLVVTNPPQDKEVENNQQPNSPEEKKPKEQQEQEPKPPLKEQPSQPKQATGKSGGNTNSKSQDLFAKYQVKEPRPSKPKFDTSALERIKDDPSRRKVLSLEQASASDIIFQPIIYDVESVACKIPKLTYQDVNLGLLKTQGAILNGTETQLKLQGCGTPRRFIDYVKEPSGQAFLELRNNICKASQVMMQFTPEWDMKVPFTLTGFYNAENQRFDITKYQKAHPNSVTEYIVAKCGKLINVAFTILEKSEVVGRMEKILKLAEEEEEEPRPLNIALVYLDSVSRASGLRGLPHTMSLLKKLHGNRNSSHRSFGFVRYNVVGSNTPNNMVPVLSGYRFPILPEKCYNCPEWLFNKAKKQGFTTMYSINTCGTEAGSFERYFTKVLQKDMLGYPTNVARAGRLLDPLYRIQKTVWDHSLAPLWCPAFMHDKLNQGVETLKAPKQIEWCFSGERLSSYLFQHLAKYFNSYPGHRKFSLTKFQEPHEPTHQRLSSLDTDIEQFFEKVVPQHRDTLFVFAADHGVTQGPLFEHTDVGKIEHKMPMLYFLVPNWFLKEYPQAETALTLNQQRFLTGFDLYATMSHLIEDYPQPFQPYSHAPRGRSMLEEVPADRECEDALGTFEDCEQGGYWCPVSFCTCINWVEVKDTQKLEQLTTASLQWVNDHNKDYPQCVPLKLKAVSKAHEWGIYNRFRADSFLFRIEITTENGVGYFEENFQITFRGHPTTPAMEPIQMMSVIHMSQYIVYDSCRGDGDKHTCVCQIDSFSDRIPIEEDRKQLACQLGKCMEL